MSGTKVLALMALPLLCGCAIPGEGSRGDIFPVVSHTMYQQSLDKSLALDSDLKSLREDYKNALREAEKSAYALRFAENENASLKRTVILQKGTIVQLEHKLKTAPKDFWTEVPDANRLP